MEQVSILLNGEKKTLRKGISVEELLKQFNVTLGAVVVEVNETVLKKDAHPTVRLQEGDRVELVRFVGGGERQ